jgi:hypothetical protein
MFVSPVTRRLGAALAALALALTAAGCGVLEPQSEEEQARLQAWLERTHGPGAALHADPEDPALKHW